MVHYMQMMILTKEGVELQRPDYNLYCYVYCEFVIWPNRGLQMQSKSQLTISYCLQVTVQRASRMQS